MRTRTLVAAAVMVLLGCSCGRPVFPPTVAHPLLGQPLPEIRHRTMLDGRPFDPAQVAGKPVLVKFFADYCIPCKETLPAAERIHEAHPEVFFLGIAEDEQLGHGKRARQAVRADVPRHPRRGQRAVRALPGESMPMTFVADRAGVIRWVGGEGQTEDDLTRAVEAAR